MMLLIYSNTRSNLLGKYRYINIFRILSNAIKCSKSHYNLAIERHRI